MTADTLLLKALGRLGALAVDYREVTASGAVTPWPRWPPSGFMTSGAVGISTVGYVYDRHYAVFVINPVDHAISTAAGTEPVVHCREQPLPDPVRICKQGSRHELISSRRNSPRKRLAQRARRTARSDSAGAVTGRRYGLSHGPAGAGHLTGVRRRARRASARQGAAGRRPTVRGWLTAPPLLAIVALGLSVTHIPDGYALTAADPAQRPDRLARRRRALEKTSWRKLSQRRWWHDDLDRRAASTARDPLFRRSSRPVP